MSKTTIRKRIALTATTAMFAGLLSFGSIPVASAAAGDTNLTVAAQAGANTHLLLATQNSTTGASVMPTVGIVNDQARSLGLLSHSGTTGTAQTATILAGGSVILYASVSTDVAFTSTGGSFSAAIINGAATSVAYSNNVQNVFLDVTGANQATTSIALRWTAPSSVGTYTVSMNRSNDTYQVAADTYSGTLTGAIKFTTVATSAGGKYDAANSACDVQTMSGVATGVDTTATFTNGSTAYIRFDLDDAYDQSLASGNIVATATNGAFVSNGANAATAAAGTGGNAVVAAAPTNRLVQVVQGTADAPVTTTVTISFDGTTVCTKTITIRGEVSKLVIGSVGTQNLSAATGSAGWILDGTNRAGLFTVQAQDSAGNVVATDAGGSFTADSATLTTTVQALSVNNTATSTSSTSAHSAGTGLWTCGAVAGQSDVVLKWTNSGTGTVISSPKITARCAGAAYTYTVAFDKKKYTEGELATLTVQFLDSKGNKANSVGSHGALTATTSMMTAVTAHTTGVAKADGTKVYTFTVGTTSGLTAGTYTAIIDYASLTAVAATKQTPTYTLSTGLDTTTNADVLKSIVALIASINKQIQALQKLILKR